MILGQAVEDDGRDGEVLALKPLDVRVQREQPVPVWGEAAVGEKITVKFRTQEKSATADAKGKWKLTLDALKAGGPDALTGSASPATGTATNTVTIGDVLVGEVWVGSGQSNMEMAMGAAKDGAAEAAAAQYPSIRLFFAGMTIAQAPADDVPGQRVVCSPATVGNFSAVGYFFGRQLHQTLGVPVGLINDAWGGSAAEAWVKPTATMTVAPRRASWVMICSRWAALVISNSRNAMPVSLRKRSAPTLADWLKDRSNFPPKSYTMAGRKSFAWAVRSSADTAANATRLNRAKERSGFIMTAAGRTSATVQERI